MGIFKCKMCGASLEFSEGSTVTTCEYCNSQQTLPSLNDSKKASLYERANNLRRDNEFDKAAEIFEQILNEDGTDAEVYWSLVLCHYGIEYVEDPTTHKRTPTVNRAQYTSIYDDSNYKAALQYADYYQKKIYEEEAKTINEIQKGILTISQNEDPFDVFICYKESDHAGRRTPDSVLAQELYYELQEAGFKVFFARITLEDKLGTAYEPYIFAALNSAKVMVVLGTKKEYFEAVWVKNEWSRYLSLIKGGAKKILIPAYRDMDAYNLPEEFSHLQAQDMSKLGFMQDLIHGIKKMVNVNKPSNNISYSGESATNDTDNPKTAPLLERAFIFLEDGDWESADEYAEKVLDIEPKNANAYLAKLMVEKKVRKKNELKNCTTPFDNSSNYQKIIRFGDSALQSELSEYLLHIRQQNNLALYNKAVMLLNNAKTSDECMAAANYFKSLGNYSDSHAKLHEANEKIKHLYQEEQRLKNSRLEYTYQNAVTSMNNANDINTFSNAMNIFRQLGDYKDSRQRAMQCETKLASLRAAEAQARYQYTSAAPTNTNYAYINELESKKKKYTVLGIVFFFLWWPVGIYFFYKSSKISKKIRQIQ